MKHIYYMKWYSLSVLFVVALLLTACDSGNAAQQAATPTQQPVNGFGGSNNHVHSLLALPNHVLVLASHFGLFRSADDGATWKTVAAGPGQLMQGQMTYSLSVSPLNPQRMYVLTQPAVSPVQGTPGLYTSADQGQTWKLATPASTVSSLYIYSAVAGNDTPDEVYIYVTSLGSLGLKVSLDDGQHFSTTGTLPFQLITNVLPIPGMPGTLLAYGSEGVARSTDGGIHWQVIKGVNDSIQQITTAGPHSPLYATGGQGIYVSQDEGASFTLVSTAASYGSLVASPTTNTTLYGKAATAIYRSIDGGKNWSPLPAITGSFKHLGDLAVDPNDPGKVYLSVSYPTEMYALQQGNTTWSSLTPKV